MDGTTVTHVDGRAWRVTVEEVLPCLPPGELRKGAGNAGDLRGDARRQCDAVAMTERKP